MRVACRLVPAAFDAASFTAVLRAEGDALGATPADVLDRQVPGCPDWNVAQLIAHTSWVHRWVTAILTAAPDAKVSRRDVPTAPEGPAVLAWYREGFAALLDAFAAIDLDATHSTFVGPRDGWWWLRRQVHETAVHRWDAESAHLPAPRPVDAPIAVDGIDEALEVHVVRRFDSEAFGASGQTLHLHATDIEGEWMFTMTPEGLTWTRAHGKGDVALRGSASDLLLWVWGRLPTERFACFGDGSLATRWQAAANLG